MKVLLPSLGLLGFILLYLGMSRNEKTYRSDVVPQGRIGGENTRAEKNQGLTNMVMEERAKRQRKREEADKLMAKNGRRMDPQTKLLLINRLIETRRPIYEELFASWNLDGATQENLLTVIREREEMLFDAHRDLNLVGREGLDAFKESYELEKALAEAHFFQLVGVERGKKILELEQSLQTRVAQKAEELVEKHLMD